MTGNLNAHRMDQLIPAPRSVDPDRSEFVIDEETIIAYQTPDAESPARALASFLRRSTGFELPVGTSSQSENVLRLTTESDLAPDSNGYELTVEPGRVLLEASGTAGLFAGIATIRQLLPPLIESPRKQPGPWIIHGGTVRDSPRFSYRGAQLDVARHFFSVDDVKRFIDLISLYKCNYLHLHLTDDQGWRLEIDGWPKLIEIGASTNIKGGDGGYYTQAEYTKIVEYAASQGITIVPEIDMPAHMGAAVASYPDLAQSQPPDGMPAEHDHGTLAVDNERTYEFVEAVIEQVAALTPGPYLHIGADEAWDLEDDEYTRFIDRTLPLVADTGKRTIAWQEIAVADPPKDTIIQYWKDTEPEVGGHDVIFSPNTHTYLNFRYEETTPPDGPETWDRRITSVPTSYDWDPGDYYAPVEESSVRGVEFELWSEELRTFGDVAYMALPRLAGIAERGWSTPETTSWEGYATRIANHGDRWAAMGLEFYRSPEIEWR